MRSVFAARPLRLDLESIAELRTPCIFHWDLNHFVVLKEATRKHIIIHDPARGERRLAYGDRWFAFPPLKGGTKWKTLDDVDVVIVAAVDDRDDPQRIEVYWFDAVEVRKRFDESYAARIQAGQTVKDNFGMWVNLDKDDRGLPASVGAGLAVVQSPVATYSIEELVGENGSETTVVSDGGGGESEGETSRHEPHTIAEVMDWARKRIATLSGVRTEAVKLDCRIRELRRGNGQDRRVRRRTAKVVVHPVLRLDRGRRNQRRSRPVEGAPAETAPGKSA